MKTDISIRLVVSVVVDGDALYTENANPQQIVMDEITSNLESVRYVKSVAVRVINEGERK